MATVTEPKELRVLPADVYDTLEFSALAFGGIGAWARRDWTPPGNGESPLCLFGHAVFASNPDKEVWLGSPLAVELERAGFDVSLNDNAVVRINQRKGKPDHGTRVTFRQWCAELGVVRGE